LSTPRKADEKSTILVRRGVFDSLARQALERAIDRRNEAEHDYKRISLPEAQDVVHTVRATVENAVARSGPYDLPALFGTIMGGMSVSKGVRTGSFDGWSGSAFVLVTTTKRPWAGIIVPKNETEAVVRRVDFEKLSSEQLIEALSIAESLLADQDISSCCPDLWHARLIAAGLLA
jgi:hypothetical protein